MPTFKTVQALSAGPYTGDYNWNTNANWDVFPTSGSTLTLPNGSYTSVDDIPQLSNLTLSIGSGVTFIVATGDTLGLQNFNQFDSSAKFQVDGSATIANGAGGNYVVDGSLTFSGNLNGTSKFLISGGSTTFQASVNIQSATAFDFTNVPKGTITIANANNYQNGWTYTVSGFNTLDIIALGSNVFVAGSTPVYNAGAHTLSVARPGGNPFIFQNFTLGAGAVNSFIVTANSIENVCFAEGTRLLTTRGYIAVERLAVGDQVLTPADVSCAWRPVTWIGERRVDLARHPDPAKAAPIRIAARAITAGAPSRDLLVSPDHCLFIDGVLIPSKLLVNGGTIVQEIARPRIRYFHVELDRHSVVLAENLATESYLDTGNRAWFDRKGGVQELHPAFEVAAADAQWQIHAAAPLATDEAIVRPVWARLARRSLTLGFSHVHGETSEDALIHIRCGKRVIRPTVMARDRYVFPLPAGARDIRLMSRASAPGALRPWLDDRRILGVAVEGIVLHDGHNSARLPLDHPALADGWHAFSAKGDAARRWTTGDARIVLPAGRATTIEFTLVSQAAYLVAEPKAA